MTNFIKRIEDDKIIFENLNDNTKLEVIHYADENSFDSITISDKYDLNFIKFIINELKSTGDILMICLLSESKKINNLLVNEGFTILNYQYTIKYTNDFPIQKYEIIKDEINEFTHIDYKKDKKIVGSVEYKFFEYGIYNNKICVKNISSNNDKIYEDIIKNLLNTYKKDIIITITEIREKKIIEKLNGKLDYCLYILISEVFHGK